MKRTRRTGLPTVLLLLLVLPAAAGAAKPEGEEYVYKTVGERWYYETVTAADKFLASLGWLSGPPTLQKPRSVK